MNPYLRVSLVSETKSEQTKVSQVQKNTAELQFEEEFVFNEISQDDLETHVSILRELLSTRANRCANYLRSYRSRTSKLNKQSALL